MSQVDLNEEAVHNTVAEVEKELRHSAKPLTTKVAELLIQKLSDEHASYVYLKRRVDLLVWVGIAMLLILTLGAVLRFMTFYTMRADITRRDAALELQLSTIKDLSDRNNRLRVDNALKDARIAAIKGLDSVNLKDITEIQSTLDRIGLQMAEDNSVYSATTDGVRRLACGKLAEAGYKCAP